jgi:hypothetical protein
MTIITLYSNKNNIKNNHNVVKKLSYKNIHDLNNINTPLKMPIDNDTIT